MFERRVPRLGPVSAAGLSILAALFAAVPAGSAQPVAQPVAAATEAAAPAPVETVALDEMVGRLETTELLLRKTRELVETGERIAEAEAALPDLRARIDQRLGALGSFLESKPSRARLSGALADWRYSRQRLSDWKDSLATRAEHLVRAQGSVEQERDLWVRTRDQVEASGIPAAVRARLDTTIESCESVLRLTRGRRDAVLTLQDQFVQLQLVTDDAIGRIAAAVDAYRARLFQPDAEPLWRDLWSFRFGEQTDAVLQSLKEDLRSLRDFATTDGPRLLLDLLVFAVLLYGSLALRRRVAKWTESDPALGRAASMFQRPISLALLAAMLLLPSLHIRRPSVVADLVRTLLLFPVVRLLTPLFDAAVRPVLGAVAALYLVVRIQDLLDASVLGKHVLFLLQLVASIVLLLWLMRPARLKKLPASTRLPGALGLGMRIAMGLLLAALLAGALGYRSLSTLIGDGVLTSVFVALVAFSIVRATEVVLRVVLHTSAAQRLGLVRQRSETLVRVSTRIAATIVSIVWLLLTLDAFAVRDPLLAAWRSLLETGVEVGELRLSVGDILAFALTLAAAFAISSVIRFFLVEEVFTRMHLRRGIPYAISTLLHYVILMLGLILALSAAGMDFTRVTLLAGAFGVGIGFGLQTVVNNFVSGLILLFERPIQTGDIIDVGEGTLGEVRRIGARSSTVRTFDGAEVIVPNANLISNKVVNWTLSDRLRRIDVTIGVAYGTDPARVLELLRQVASEETTVLKHPQPQALFTDFGDSSLDFLLRVWIPRFEDGLQLKSDLSVKLCAALAEAGIEIPFPQRDLHLRSVPEGIGPPIVANTPDEEV